MSTTRIGHAPDDLMAPRERRQFRHALAKANSTSVTLASEIEGRELSVVLDQYDRLRLPRLGIAAHSRGIRRHPRQGQSNRVGPLIEQPENGTGRHVPFDHVAIDQSRVARRGALRNTVFRFECSQLRILIGIDAGSEILQVPDPP